MNPLAPHRAVLAVKHGSWAACALAFGLLASAPAMAATSLADAPLFSSVEVPGNMALALSVEYPTAISVANLNNYAGATTYLGYFDPFKCYSYEANAATPGDSYFQPRGLAATGHDCSGNAAGRWSGNFLNWATMQTIDPYRWALTGGYRSVDSTSMTILEKAWGSNQGSNNNFPNRGTGMGNGHQMAAADIPLVTPFTGWNGFKLRIWGRGNTMVFSSTGNENSGTATDWQDGLVDVATAYQVRVRVRVCDPAVAAGGLEANCKGYSNDTIFKPEGLMQQYALKIRYSAFGYLNDSDIRRDGGALRARMAFIGPRQPVPQSNDIANVAPEWDAGTGIMISNPVAADATGSSVSNSGVMNYLNKFGQASRGYKTYDNVGELYYAAIRYFKNQGNVPEWTNNLTTGMKDGFPVITTWEDPLQYSCQRNFVLGIGDTNTHADGNLPGAVQRGTENAMPGAVAADTTVNVTTATNKVGQLEGMGNLGERYAGGGTNNTYYIAGLAYDSHTQDIRPNGAPGNAGVAEGKQTISTYWLNVMEYQQDVYKNAYWLATKYGGFTAPSDYDPYANVTPLAEATWHTNADTLASGKRPDNYFIASKADQMVKGLTAAFEKIVSELKGYTTSFSVASPVFSASGTTSYSAQFESSNWTGELTASNLVFNPTTFATTSTALWTATATLTNQLATTGSVVGWDTNRRVVSWNGTTGVRFRATGANGLSAPQLAAMDTSYITGNDSAAYVSYLRGDRSNEVGSGVSGSLGYRARTALLGDIVDSKVLVVGAPNAGLSNAGNPGYSTFKTNYAARTPLVLVGANDGMLHAFQGRTGEEIFAYVPNAVFQGPSAPSTPNIDGLAALGNPNYDHRYYVNATPMTADVDFGYTNGTRGTADWRTMAIGGLGKGGKSYYALDVTNASKATNAHTDTSAATEADVASKVLWEFSNANMGFSYGKPLVTKTKRHGWVVVFTSGHNNADGRGYLFFVNPTNGALLETVATGVGSAASPAGLTEASAFMPDATDGTADAIYAGDLLGNVWRVDVSSPTAAYAATRIASLVSGASAQAITTAPLVRVHPADKKRYVLIGTGKLLSDTDIASSQPNAFYAIIDGTNTAFDATLGPTLVTRANLFEKRSLTTKVTLAAGQYGWYYDFGVSVSVGWRVINAMDEYYGRAAFAITLPGGDACNPSGTSRDFSVDYATGQSVKVNDDGTLVEYTDIDGLVTEVRYVLIDGKLVRIVGTSKGELIKPKETEMATTGVIRLNWRELPTAQ